MKKMLLGQNLVENKERLVLSESKLNKDCMGYHLGVFANFKDYFPLRQVPVKLGPKNFINDSLMPLVRHYQVTWRKMVVSGRIL